MASGSPSQRKARETNFTDIGVAGRKTGFTVKDTGRRDAFGMESMDAFFSPDPSPQPQPQPASVQSGMYGDSRPNATTNGNAGADNGTMSMEESMDIAISSVVEPTDVLSDRRLTSVPPLLPRARSPIKTNLGSPPRRASSIGFSSPDKRASIPPANRRLHFGSPPSAEPSPVAQLSKPAKRLSVSPFGASAPAASGSEGERLPEARSKGKGKQVMPQVAEEGTSEDEPPPPPPAAKKQKRGLLMRKRGSSVPKKTFVFDKAGDADRDEDTEMGGMDQVEGESISKDIIEQEVSYMLEDSIVRKGEDTEEEQEAPPPKNGKQEKGKEPAKQKPAPVKKVKPPPPEKVGSQPKAKVNGVGKGREKAREEEPEPLPKTKAAVKGNGRAIRRTGKPYEGKESDEELECPEPVQHSKSKVPAKDKGKSKARLVEEEEKLEGEEGGGEEQPRKPKAASKGKARVKPVEALGGEKEEKEEPAPKAKAPSKGKTKAKMAESEAEQAPEPSQQAKVKPVPRRKVNAKPTAAKAREPEPALEIPESEQEEDEQIPAVEQEVEQPARKRPRKTPKETSPPQKASAKSKGKAPAISKASKKPAVPKRREYSPELESHVPSPLQKPAAKEASSSRSSRPQKEARGGQRMIKERPVSEPAGEGRRSMRQRIKPLEFWKGEKVVYALGERRKSGAADTIKMPEIAEIIRVESDPEEKGKEKERRRKKSASAGSKRKRSVKEEESDYEEEDWETTVVDGEVGVVRGYVKSFPPSQIPGQEQLEEAELAFSRNRIVTVEVAHGDFTFVKTCTQPFFGTGMIEIPPGGAKRTKNSGKMQLVFYMLAGKVQVQIGETSFRIRKGSQFMVPRGNLYSIENPYDHQAKMFFAQGCEVDEEG